MNTLSILLAAVLIAFAGPAAAQSASGPSVPDADAAHNPLAVVASLPLHDVLIHDVLAQRVLNAYQTWRDLAAGTESARRWAIGNPLEIGSTGFALRPKQPSAIRRINRRFLPIPLVGWQHRLDLLSPHGSIAIRPSIVVGRRLTALPEVYRASRTIGLAVEMKIRLDPPAAPVKTDGASDPASAVLSRLRGLIDRDGR